MPVAPLPAGTPRVSCQANAVAERSDGCGRAWLTPAMPGEGGLADAGAGEQGGKRGVPQRSHGALGMELASIVRPEMRVGRRPRRDKAGYRA